jgi:thymidylate synthase (FAD)
MKLKVLDKGSVELLDIMGNDTAIVQAARISYGKETKGEEQDKKLIRYLLKHKHLSPFEQAHIKYRIKAPIFVFRQLQRHRQHWNEISARYTEVVDEYYQPSLWRGQGKGQTSGTYIHDAMIQLDLSRVFCNSVEASINAYHLLLSTGVSREQARMVLPQSMYSEAIFSCDLRNLLNLFDQRIHEGAQEETQSYAVAMRELIKSYFPWTFEIYEEVNQKAS